MNTIQTQAVIVHLDSGLNAASVFQHDADATGFSSDAITIPDSDTQLGLGDIITPKTVFIKLIEGDPVRIGIEFDGDGAGVYPYELRGAGEFIMMPLIADSIREVTTFTAGADVARSLSGDYFQFYDRNGTVRVWFSMAAASATGTVTYGAPADGDTLTVDGTTFTKVAAAPGADEFTNIAELTALILALANVNATDDGATISITAATPGAAGNAIAMSKTGAALTLSGATLAGGADASADPGGGDRMVEVAIDPDDSAATIASAIEAAFADDDEVVVTADGAGITITDRHSGARSAASNGTTGWAAPASIVTGVDSPEVHLISDGSSQIVAVVSPR